MSEPLGPHFINVDLDIVAREDLAALAEALESRSVVLFSGKSGGRFRLSIEANRSYISPEATIRALLKLVNSLSPRLKALWNRADSRTFDIGYGAGNSLQELHETRRGSGVWKAMRGDRLRPHLAALSPELLRAVAAVGAGIATSVYPATRMIRSRRTR